MHGSIPANSPHFPYPQCSFHFHELHLSEAPAQQILLLSQVSCGKEKRAVLILVRVIWTYAFWRSGTTKKLGHVQGTAEGGKIPFSARLFYYFFLVFFNSCIPLFCFSPSHCASSFLFPRHGLCLATGQQSRPPHLQVNDGIKGG